MNFTVLLSAVIKQLGEVASIAGSAPNKEDITQNILICAENGVLTLKATNYNIELITVINEVTIESEGRITVNAKKIKEILGNLDPNVLVNFEYIADKALLKISTPVSNFEIRTRAADDFPSFDVENIDQTIVVQQKQLKNLIDSSIFCVSNEDFRDYLKGIRLELLNGKLDVFTSDGHRMAVIELKLEGQTVQNPSGTFGAIITKSCAQQLSKILEESAESTVTLQFTKNAVLTTCNNYSLASKLINCGYPNVRAIIPKSIDKSVLVPKDELSALIKQISVLSSKRANGITFNFGDGLVRFPGCLYLFDCYREPELDERGSAMGHPGLCPCPPVPDTIVSALIRTSPGTANQCPFSLKSGTLSGGADGALVDADHFGKRRFAGGDGTTADDVSVHQGRFRVARQG